MDDQVPIIQQMAEERQGGLGIITCAVFIVGEIAGSGVLALPAAVEGAGWSGLIIMVLCCLISAYTGNILGKAWMIVRKRNIEYQIGHVRYPYPAIGQEAFGRFGRNLVSISINFTLFGVGVVFLLLASINIANLLEPYWPDVSFCYIGAIVAGCLIPVSWLGTPADFWFVAVGATCATAIACCILLGNVIYDGEKKVGALIHNEIDFTSFSVAFGTICFGFGGHPAFPTFQADMKKQENFGWAVLVGYLIVLAMYFPVSAAGYFVYGGQITDNILDVVSRGPAHTVVSILIIAHLMLGFIIVINPFCQEIEHLLKIPTHFSIKRVMSRTTIVIVVLFVAESVPHFGSILSLVGGSTTTLLAYICPPLFYLKLCRQKPSTTDNWEPEPEVPLHTKVINYEIIAVGFIAGVASTYSALKSLITDHFTVPCYINPIEAGK
ncbi:uncharacterized protein LOC132713072 isoform X2 [Ruditapes philippinarum]|uniref:uncharacterized protein LOC132713072 isoform X2 n=1 Tax=Ruditapes philippinarum TaxID=129788 RepID=UPI00295B1B5D|nr:uncharacterized protein LOC132713072 isoform X2 [Ruditapes philippinarum]XP_060551544.1 uncharacterized protein LOC132713072 isoform X2 [Ruditapes philippinarum]